MLPSPYLYFQDSHLLNLCSHHFQSSSGVLLQVSSCAVAADVLNRLKTFHGHFDFGNEPVRKADEDTLKCFYRPALPLGGIWQWHSLHFWSDIVKTWKGFRNYRKWQEWWVSVVKEKGTILKGFSGNVVFFGCRGSNPGHLVLASQPVYHLS